MIQLLIIICFIPVFVIGQTVGLNNNKITVDSNGCIESCTAKVDSIIYKVTPARISAYVSSSAATTITAAGTYYFAQGTFTNENTASFTFSGDTLIYNNGNNRVLIGSYKFSISTNGTNVSVSVAIYINDTKLNMSEQTTLCKTAGEQYHISGNIMLVANTGDKIKIMVTCDDAGKLVTINKGSTILHQIP